MRRVHDNNHAIRFYDPGPPNVPHLGHVEHYHHNTFEDLAWRFLLYLCALFALMCCWKYFLFNEVEGLMVQSAKPVTARLNEIADTLVAIKENTGY